MTADLGKAYFSDVEQGLETSIDIIFVILQLVFH